MRFGTALRKLRKKKGLSAVHLGDISGVSRSYILRLEYEQERRPTLDVVLKLARGLGVDAIELLRAAGYKGDQNEAESKDPILEPELELFFSGEWNELSDEEKDWVRRTIRMVREHRVERTATK